MSNQLVVNSTKKCFSQSEIHYLIHYVIHCINTLQNACADILGKVRQELGDVIATTASIVLMELHHTPDYSSNRNPSNNSSPN